MGCVTRFSSEIFRLGLHFLARFAGQHEYESAPHGPWVTGLRPSTTDNQFVHEVHREGPALLAHTASAAHTRAMHAPSALG
jgi:hypothetical protein